MLLTIYLAVVFCAAITLLLISAVAFVQYDGTNKWFFSSAPQEALELLKPRNKELFYGAKAMGCQILGCSRQNIDDLMKRGKLHPIRRDAKYKLFLRSEVAQRRQQTNGQ